MIVSNFNSSAPSAIQGIDFLERASKADSSESAPSNFSDLLDENGSVTAKVTEQGQAQSNLRNTSAARAKVKGNVDRGSGGADSAKSTPKALDGAASDDFGASGGLSALVDEPPLIRDPRLEDPEELALEAAAIAIAAALLQKAQETVVHSGLQDEAQLEFAVGQEGASAGSEGGDSGEVALPSSPFMHTGGAGSEASSPGGVSQPTFGKSVLLASQVALEAQRNAAVQQQQLEAGATSGGVGRVKVAASVAPRVIPVVVVTASPAEADALASGGVGEVLAMQSGSMSPSEARWDAAASQSLAAALEESQGGENASFVPEAFQQSPETVDGQSASDKAFLASAPPPNPSVAFFAARAEARNSTESLQQKAEDGSMTQSESVSQLDSGALQKPAPASGHSEGGNSRSNAETLPERPPQTKPGNASSAQPDVNNEAHAGRGTFGAKDGGVQSERSPIMVQTQESVAAVNSGVEESSSSVSTSPSADSQGIMDFSRGISTEGLNRSLSRPTVLPPVQTRMSELHNVLHNALERARSENPSHLAVEITLNDGSSFGLEVRMSASGLQASFRSDSQPLLRALENGWAGFLARDSADQKVAAAVFEGRSGLGDFSQNESGAGERRQQFEDGTAAAVLQGLDARGSGPGKAHAEQDLRKGEAGSEMALYA